MPKLEFFFDFSSPWTYMAFTRIGPLCAETGAELIWKPFYVAAVFRQANHEVAAKRAAPVPAKLDYYWTDMQRWADRPRRVHPRGAAGCLPRIPMPTHSALSGPSPAPAS